MTASLSPLEPHTAAELATLARFDAAEYPPEVLRERVAIALSEAMDDGCFDRLMYTEQEWENGDGEEYREDYRRFADAVLAVIAAAGPVLPDPAIQRVLDLADDEHYEWGVRHSRGTRVESSERAAREALNWLTEQHKRSRRGTLKPHLVRRRMTDWQPVNDGADGAS